MKLNLHRAQVLPVVFVIVSISSAAYISVASINYMRFFPALAQLSSQITKVAFFEGPKGLNLSASVTVDNPSDYSGFTLHDLNLKLFLWHPNASTGMNQTLFADNSELFGNIYLDRDLAPHSQIASTVYFGISPQERAAISDFNRSYYGQIFANVVMTVHVFTFLYSATGFTTIPVTRNLPLS